MASVAYSLRSVDPLGATTLYIVCRFLRPQHVVETGVASGVSSAAILQALADNGRGDLHSISLPESAQSDVDREALGGQELGWLIPDSLRGRWALHRGYSRDVLPELLSELDVVNVFFHDSDHAFENVLFELSTVLPRLSVPGLIAVDDANFSYVCEAFLSICKKSGSRPIFVPRLVPPPQTIGISLVS
jgi:predicted O-methyltransferase YrrM